MVLLETDFASLTLSDCPMEVARNSWFIEVPFHWLQMPAAKFIHGTIWLSPS
jgi:hypothetical protein